MVKSFLRKANSFLLAAALTVTLMPVQTVSAAGADGAADSAVSQTQADWSKASVLDLAAVTGKEYTVIEGNAPVLPKKVNVTSDDGILETVEIDWRDWNKNLAPGTHRVSGGIGRKQIYVTVNVLPCDEEVPDAAATGRDDGTNQEKLDAIHPLKGYKGLFVAEYDIVPDEVKSTHDRAVIYLPEAMNDGKPLDAGNCWDTGARLQFKYSYQNVTYFQTQIGDGQVVNNAKYYPTNGELDQALANGEEVSALSFDEVSTYRVRVVMDTVTDKVKGNYKVYITDPEGIEHEVTQPGGNGFRIYPKDGVIKNFAAVRGSYRLQNHKISWISGYAAKKVETYLKGQDAQDYVKEDKDVVTKELPGVITERPKQEIVRDNQTYVLDAEKSGWYDGGQKTDSVTAEENETVIYRAYYYVEKNDDTDKEEIETAKKELETSITAAEQKMAEVREADYTPASWNALKEALEACRKLDPETASKADYEAKKEALNRALQGLLKLADKTALNQAIAAADSLKEADYQAAGYQEMQVKLAAAKAAAVNPDAVQSEVDKAYKELQDSFAKLVKKVKAESIRPAAKTYKIAAGRKLDLKKVFTVLPQNADNKNLIYSLDKKYSQYASIKSGVVTVKKKGTGKTVTVKAAAADGSGKTAVVKIKIMKHAVTKITVRKKSFTVKAGGKITIKPVVTANGKSANKTLEYISSNEKLATVKKGVVTARKGKTGKVTVTVKSTDGTGKSVKIKITVKK